jgi:hypothetical protein
MTIITELCALSPITCHLAPLIILMWLGAILGMTFADIDLAPPLPLSHRSAWTHGVFIPLGLLTISQDNPLARAFSLGFLPLYALHLAYDMFPAAWQSIACISLYPLKLRLPGWLSFLYLWLGAVVALGVWLALGPLWWELSLVTLLGLVYGAKYAHKESGWPWNSIPPLGAVVIAGMVVLFI